MSVTIRHTACALGLSLALLAAAIPAAAFEFYGYWNYEDAGWAPYLAFDYSLWMMFADAMVED